MLLGQIRRNLENSSESQQVRALQEALKLGQEGISLFAHYSVQDTPEKVRQASYWLLLGYNPVEDPQEKYIATDTISCVVITPDNRLVIGGSWQFIYVWDFKTGKLLHKLSAHSHWVLSVTIDKVSNTLVSASADGHIAVWDLESWQCEFKWKAHKSWVTKVAIVSKPRWIISSSLDGLIAVWKIQSQPPTQPEFHLQDQGGAVWSFDLDWSKNSLISGGADGKVKVWDLKSRKVVQTIEDSTRDVREISKAQDIYSFWVSRSDNTLEHWHGYTPIPNLIRVCVLLGFLPIEYFLDFPLIYKLLCLPVFLGFGLAAVVFLNNSVAFNKLRFKKEVNSKSNLSTQILLKLQKLNIVSCPKNLYDDIKIKDEEFLSLLNRDIGVISSIAINSNSKVFVCAGLNWLNAWKTPDKQLSYEFEGATYPKPVLVQIQAKVNDSEYTYTNYHKSCISIYAGDYVSLKVVGYDRNQREIEVKDYQWEPQEYVTSQNQFLTNKSEGFYTLKVYTGTKESCTTFKVLNSPVLKKLDIIPKTLDIRDKDPKKIKLSWKALDQYNQPFSLDERQLTWDVTDGRIKNGWYKVPNKFGRFQVTLKVKNSDISDTVTINHLESPKLKKLFIEPQPKILYCGETYNFKVRGIDQNGNPFSCDRLKWKSNGGEIRWSDATAIFKAGQSPTQAKISVRQGPIHAQIYVQLLSKIELARLRIYPDLLNLRPGQTRQLTVRGWDRNGDAFDLNQEKVVWTVIQGDANVDTRGVLTGESQNSTVKVECLGKEDIVEACVIKTPRLVHLIIESPLEVMQAGKTYRFAVWGRDSDGNKVTVDGVKWAANVGKIDSQGILILPGQCKNTVEVTAQLEEVKNTVTLPIKNKSEKSNVKSDLVQLEPEEQTKSPIPAKIERIEIEPNLVKLEPEEQTKSPIPAKIERIEIEPNLVKLEPEEQVTLQVVGLDKMGNRRSISPQNVNWHCDVGGYINQCGLFHFQYDPCQRFVKVYATFREFTTNLYTEVSIEQLSILTRLEIQPKTVVELYPREQQQFKVLGFDQFGKPVKNMAVEWYSLAGEFNADGLLTVDTEIADFYDVTATASRFSRASLSLNIKLIGEYLKIVSKILKFLSSRKFYNLVDGIQGFIDDDTGWSKFVDILQMKPDERLALKLLAKVLHEIAKICIDQNKIYIRVRTRICIKETVSKDLVDYDSDTPVSKPTENLVKDFKQNRAFRALTTAFRQLAKPEEAQVEEPEEAQVEEPEETQVEEPEEAQVEEPEEAQVEELEETQVEELEETQVEEPKQHQRLRFFYTTWSTTFSRQDLTSKLPSHKYDLRPNDKNEEASNGEEDFSQDKLDALDYYERNPSNYYEQEELWYDNQDVLDYYEYVKDKMTDTS
jgi:hypothetical protein